MERKKRNPKWSYSFLFPDAIETVRLRSLGAMADEAVSCEGLAGGFDFTRCLLRAFVSIKKNTILPETCQEGKTPMKLWINPLEYL